MRLLAAQEPIPNYFLRLQELPSALQEAPKRLSDAFRVEDTIRGPFCTSFGLQNEPLGPYKARNFVIHSSNFKVLHVSARIAFGPRFGTLRGLSWGPIWAQRLLKPISSVPLGRPRADSGFFFSAPEVSKSAPRGIQEAKRRLDRFLDPPSDLQERFGTHCGAMLVSTLEQNLELCW